jgi:hypothetical protein
MWLDPLIRGCNIEQLPSIIRQVIIRQTIKETPIICAFRHLNALSENLSQQISVLVKSCTKSIKGTQPKTTITLNHKVLSEESYPIIYL